MIIKLLIPIATVSEANINGKTKDKWKRKAYQKQLSFVFAKNYINEYEIDYNKIKLSKITCIRHGKRQLDEDNLASCFKAIIDGVSNAFEVNDRDVRMFFEQTIKNKEPYTELILELK